MSEKTSHPQAAGNLAMGWFKDEYALQDRLVLLTLSVQQAYSEKLDVVLRDAQADPRHLEAWVKALLAVHRPTLADACVLHMRFDSPTCTWQFLVSHGSLAPVAWGDEPPRERLIPQET